MSINIFVVGGGGHAKVIISILKKLSNFNIIGYTDLNSLGEILGIKYLGTDSEIQKSISKSEAKYALGIGLTTNFAFRRKIIDQFSIYHAPQIISPHAMINEDVHINDGTVVMDGVIVNSGTWVGKFSILNTSCSIDHDCNIGNNVHVAPGTILSGGISIGDNVLLGTGTKIVQSVSICDNVITGAGSVIIKNITQSGIYVGAPAKKIKEFGR